MSLRAVTIVLLLLICASAPLSADIVITWQGSRSQGRTTEADAFTERIRAARQREDHGDDLKPGTTAYSIIRDLAAAREYLLWHGFRQYRETVMKTVAERTKGQVPWREREKTQLTVTPRKETRTIAGLECEGFDVKAAMADGHVALSGTFWAARKGKAVAEYQRFYKRLREFSPVAAVNVKPGREEVQGVREEREAFLNAAADVGFPCLVDYQVHAINRTWRFTREAVKISTTRVKPESLAIPPSYKLVRVR
jgi:hypothetical protein